MSRYLGDYSAHSFLRRMPMPIEDGLILFDKPDSVVLPIELGGAEVAVIDVQHVPCACGTPHNAEILILKTDKADVIVCALTDQFLWVRKSAHTAL